MNGAEIRAAQIHELLKGADIDGTLAQKNGSLDILMTANFRAGVSDLQKSDASDTHPNFRPRVQASATTGLRNSPIP
jgi:hypothetical protein